MKLPICELCASTSVLCPGCSIKLGKGILTSLDVEASRILAKKEIPGDVELVRAVDAGGVAFLLAKGNVGALIGRDGRVVNEISRSLNRKVRIAEYSSNVKKTLADILAPAKMLGVNKVFAPGGFFFRVRIPKSDLRLVPVNLDALEKAVQAVLGAPAKLAFE